MNDIRTNPLYIPKYDDDGTLDFADLSAHDAVRYVTERLMHTDDDIADAVARGTRYFPNNDGFLTYPVFSNMGCFAFHINIPMDPLRNLLHSITVIEVQLRVRIGDARRLERSLCQLASTLMLMIDDYTQNEVYWKKFEGSFNPYGNGQTDDFEIDYDEFIINYKQELARCWNLRYPGTPLNYIVHAIHGPPHERSYQIRVDAPDGLRVVSNLFARKRQAEIDAAQRMLDLFSKHELEARLALLATTKNGSFNPYGNGQIVPTREQRCVDYFVAAWTEISLPALLDPDGFVDVYDMTQREMFDTIFDATSDYIIEQHLEQSKLAIYLDRLWQVIEMKRFEMFQIVFSKVIKYGTEMILEGSFNPYGNGQIKVNERRFDAVTIEKTLAWFTYNAMINPNSLVGDLTRYEAFLAVFDHLLNVIRLSHNPDPELSLAVNKLMDTVVRQDFYLFQNDFTRVMVLMPKKILEGSFNPYGNGQGKKMTQRNRIDKLERLLEPGYLSKRIVKKIGELQLTKDDLRVYLGEKYPEFVRLRKENENIIREKSKKDTCGKCMIYLPPAQPRMEALPTPYDDMELDGFLYDVRECLQMERDPAVYGWTARDFNKHIKLLEKLKLGTTQNDGFFATIANAIRAFFNSFSETYNKVREFWNSLPTMAQIIDRIWDLILAVIGFVSGTTKSIIAHLTVLFLKYSDAIHNTFTDTLNKLSTWLTQQTKAKKDDLPDLVDSDDESRDIPSINETQNDGDEHIAVTFVKLIWGMAVGGDLNVTTDRAMTISKQFSALNSMTMFVKNIGPLLKTGFDIAFEALFGIPLFDPTTRASLERIDTCLRDLSVFVGLDVATMSLRQAEDLVEIRESVSDDLINVAKSSSFPRCNTFLSVIRNTDHAYKIAKMIVNRSGARLEPIGIFVNGPPKIGKTTLTPLLNRNVLTYLYGNVEADPTHFMQQASEYMDGYIPGLHRALVLDEAFQTKDAQNTEVLTMRTLEFIGTSGTPLNMAFDKGNVMLNCNIIELISNAEQPPWPALNINHPAAMMRRLFGLRVKLRTAQTGTEIVWHEYFDQSRIDETYMFDVYRYIPKEAKTTAGEANEEFVIWDGRPMRNVSYRDLTMWLVDVCLVKLDTMAEKKRGMHMNLETLEKYMRGEVRPSELSLLNKITRDTDPDKWYNTVKHDPEFLSDDFLKFIVARRALYAYKQQKLADSLAKGRNPTQGWLDWFKKKPVDEPSLQSVANLAGKMDDERLQLHTKRDLARLMLDKNIPFDSVFLNGRFAPTVWPKSYTLVTDVDTNAQVTNWIRQMRMNEHSFLDDVDWMKVARVAGATAALIASLTGAITLVTKLVGISETHGRYETNVQRPGVRKGRKVVKGSLINETQIGSKNLNDQVNVIRNNYVKVRIETDVDGSIHTASGNGIFMLQDIMVVNMHYVALAFDLSKPTKVIVTIGMKEIVNNLKDVRCRAWQDDDERTNDLVSMKIPGVQPFHDIRSYFMFAKDFDDRNLHQAVRITPIINKGVDINVTHMRDGRFQAMSVVKPSKEDKPVVMWDENEYEYASYDVITYGIGSTKGDCISVYAIDNDSAPQKLFALHAGLINSSRSVAIIVNQEMIAKYVTPLVTEGSVVQCVLVDPLTNARVALTPATPPDNLPEKIFYHGEVPENLYQHLNRKTRIKRTNLCLDEKPTRIPRRLHPVNGGPDPLDLAMMRWGKGPERPNSRYYDLAWEMLTEVYMRGATYRAPSELSIVDAINKPPLTTCYSPLKMATSAGFGLNRLHEYGPGKHCLMSENIDVDTGKQDQRYPNKPTDLLLRICRDWDIDVENGTCPMFPYAITLKDELGAIATVESNKTRAFAGGSTANQVQQRRFFGAFVEQVMYDPLMKLHTLGINMNSFQGRELYAKMSRWKKNFFFDVKNNDQMVSHADTVKFGLMRMRVAAHLDEFPGAFDGTEKTKQRIMRSRIAINKADESPWYLLRKSLFSQNGSTSSGDWFTSIKNNAVNFVRFYTASMELLEQRFAQSVDWTTAKYEFFKFFGLVTNGDDILAGTNLPLTFNDYKEKYKTLFGIEITAPQKNRGEERAEGSIDDAEYLSRTPLCRDGYVFWILNEETIRNIVYWRFKNDIPDEVMYPQLVEAAMLEWVLYGPERFEKELKHYNEELIRCHCQPVNLKYHEVYQQVLDNYNG